MLFKKTGPKWPFLLIDFGALLPSLLPGVPETRVAPAAWVYMVLGLGAEAGRAPKRGPKMAIFGVIFGPFWPFLMCTLMCTYVPQRVQPRWQPRGPGRVPGRPRRPKLAILGIFGLFGAPGPKCLQKWVRGSEGTLYMVLGPGGEPKRAQKGPFRGLHLGLS